MYDVETTQAWRNTTPEGQETTLAAGSTTPAGHPPTVPAGPEDSPALSGPGLTVAEVLGLPVLQDGEPEVLAGAGKLDNPVRWVHIAENEQTSTLLEGGELVLTTGLNFRASPTATRRFLQLCFAAGASAVVVELVGDDGAPATGAMAVLREAANGAAGPVVLLKRRVRYVRVTEQVHRLLMNEQLARVQRARKVHEVFTALSLENASEQKIVDETARLVDAPVVFEDVGHLVLSFAAHGVEPAVLLDGWQGRSRQVGYSGQTGRTGGNADWLQTPVGVKGQRWGRLVVPAANGGQAVQTVAPAPAGGAAADPVTGGAAGPPTGGGAASLDEADAVQVLERAGQALTMARMAGRDRRELLHQARAGLMHELRQLPAPAEAEALARATALGLSAGAYYVPVVVRLDREPGESATGLQVRERALLETLEGSASTARQPVLAASLHAGSVGLLFPVPARQLEDPLLHRIFGQERANDGWSVGIGRSRASLVLAAAGLGEANQVAEIAATLETRSLRFYRFADVRLRGLLAMLRDDARLRSFAEAELAGLLDPLDEAGLELLGAFLENGGNKALLARTGYLSRQALYGRLARLEAKLGVRLDDAESRTALHVAILWHRLEHPSQA